MLLERLWQVVTCCPSCGTRLGPFLPEKVPK
jgi:hypothetical protein